MIVLVSLGNNKSISWCLRSTNRLSFSFSLLYLFCLLFLSFVAVESVSAARVGSSSGWQILDMAASTISKLSSSVTHCQEIGEGETMMDGDSGSRAIEKISFSIVELYEGYYSAEVSSYFC